VSRAGASSLAEFAAVRLPPVLVPLPTAADNHQYQNARAFEQSGAARLLDQRTATPDQLVAALLVLSTVGPERAQVRAALGRWHAPRAAADIAAQIIASLPVEIRRSAVAAAARGAQPAEEHPAVSPRVEAAA
jgi:UDP-N-acetylglucosamine--N-acetylmuramyl-(pentapeptide) pyrophosphoryl-undecaprenol N-acetylglucosamine transferase